MKIAVIGAGALGLYYGALLQKAGNDLHFLLRRDHDAITRDGLQAYSVDGDFHLDSVKGYRARCRPFTGDDREFVDRLIECAIGLEQS